MRPLTGNFRFSSLKKYIFLYYTSFTLFKASSSFLYQATHFFEFDFDFKIYNLNIYQIISNNLKIFNKIKIIIWKDTNLQF